MNIRVIQASDLQELLALYKHLHQSDEPAPSEAILLSVWRELLTSDRHLYFGCYVGEALVSSCAITVIPNLTRACRPYGVIENVVTHASHRKNGYGKALLKHTLSYAWDQGCYKVMLLTGRKDEATYRFYESAGFDRHEKQAFIAKPSF
jgi:GNAT superfamily N-acetyltransferase